MYSEELFQDLLKNRAEISNKGKRVNTERAVKALRKKLEGFHNEGYDCNAIIEKSLDESWLSVFRLKDVEPKQHHLTPKGALKDMATSCYKKPPTKERGPKHQAKAAEAVRQMLQELA